MEGAGLQRAVQTHPLQLHIVVPGSKAQIVECRVGVIVVVDRDRLDPSVVRVAQVVDIALWDISQPMGHIATRGSP